jgi:hypothetical protein
MGEQAMKTMRDLTDESWFADHAVLDKVVPAPAQWTAAQIDALSKDEQRIARDTWDADRVEALSLLEHEGLSSLVVEDESLREALLTRHPVPRPATIDVAPPVGIDALGLCRHTAYSPPLADAWGSPEKEQTGADAVVIDTGLAPAAFFGVPGARLMKTFTRQALPRDGQLSLSVALGKLPLSATAQTVHPPQDEGPIGGFLQGLAQRTQTQAGFGFAAAVPGAPTTDELETTATVDIAIGHGPQPWYLMYPGGAPGLGLSANASIHVFLWGSEGDFTHLRQKILEHHVLGSFDGLLVPPARRVSLTLRLSLRPGTRWIKFGMQAIVGATRYWLTPLVSIPDDNNDRVGFVGIDLRSPDASTSPAHALLDATGPIALRDLRTRFCPPNGNVDPAPPVVMG